MIKLEEKEYELGKFFQFDPLLKYLDALNQSHNDLKDLVSKLQLQLENKDRKISELEGKIQQNAISTDKRCKGIEITINNISKSITGLKGNNFKTKDEDKEQSKETIKSKDSVHQEDSYRSEKKNEEPNEKKQEDNKTIEKEDIIIDNDEISDKKEENKKEKNEIIENNKNNEEKEESNEEKEKNQDEITSVKVKDEPQMNYLEEKEQKVYEKTIEVKKDNENINIKELPTEQPVKSISPEMLSILFKKVKDHQSRLEELEKVSDTVLSTNKNLKHFEKNINNRVSILEQNTNSKIEDCKHLILINYSISEITRT